MRCCGLPRRGAGHGCGAAAGVRGQHFGGQRVWADGKRRCGHDFMRAASENLGAHVAAQIAVSDDADQLAVALDHRHPRDAELAAQGVEVMDGDPLGWEWKLG